MSLILLALACRDTPADRPGEPEPRPAEPPDPTDPPAPDTDVPPDSGSQRPAVPFLQVGLGEWDGCGVTLTGEAYCWGGDPNEEPYLDVPLLNP